MPFIGADIEALRRLSRDLQRSGRRMNETTQAITAQMARSTWTGTDAERFQASWAQIRAQLLQIDDRLEHLAHVVDRQANEQEGASGGGGAAGGRRPTGDRMYGFGDNQGPGAQGRMTVISSIMDLGDSDRIGPGQIGIRQLDNGRYVVVLPGVEDLSSGLDRFGPGYLGGSLFGTGAGLAAGTSAVAGEWLAPSDSVRDMSNAMSAATGGSNDYADAVKQAMQDAGIPPGADVMIVGHSHGAYTAIDLANDTQFNGPQGPGYHVNITHTVAIGADTDWDAGNVPSHTNVLIANNRHDAVYQAETPWHLGRTDLPDNVTRIDFNGGIDGAGHAPSNYADWFTQADDRPNLNSFLDSVGGDYAGPGYRTTARVPDPSY